MTAPAFRRPRTALSPDQVGVLVALRDGGATWREIGRVVCKQDGVCKAIYERAVRQRAACESEVQEEGEAMEKAA